MNTQKGSVWGNAGSVTRYSVPHADPTKAIDTLKANQSVTVLCYSHGDTETWTSTPFAGHPQGEFYKSDAWDFVVTGDQDPGGFVADVYIDTGGPIQNQLPVTCTILSQRLQRLSSV